MKIFIVILVTAATFVLSVEASAATICAGSCPPVIDSPPVTLNPTPPVIDSPPNTLNPTPPVKSHTMALSFAQVQSINVNYDVTTGKFTSYTNWLYHIDIYPANPSGNYQVKASVIDLPIFSDAFITNLTISSGWQVSTVSASQSSMSFINNYSTNYSEFHLTFNSTVAPSYVMPLTIFYPDNNTETIQSVLPLTPLAISAGYLSDVPSNVPEPESYAMLIAGLIVTSFFVRRAKS